MGLPIALQDVYAARACLQGGVCRTPLVPSPALSARAGAEVLLKLETMQPTGAFKLRGATNRLLALSPDERRRGVVTVSTGNHGRAVAFAARALRVPAVVCVSHLVPANKVEAIRVQGAQIVVHGRSQDEALVEARRRVEADGLVLVPPFDDPHIIAGQGTIGLELLEDVADIDSVLVPVSGGGLIGGVALALKSAAPGIRVLGVSMERGAAMHRSLAAGRPVAVEEEPTLADSLGGGIGEDNRYSFELVRRLVDDLLLVGEDEIAAAMAHAYWRERLIVEGAAAVGIAALLTGRAKGLGRRCAVIVSGNNVAMDAFTRIINERPQS